MSELDEHIIEVWVRNPESLSDSVRSEVQRRIEQYPEWRETADYWQEYYATLSEVKAPSPGSLAEKESKLELVRVPSLDSAPKPRRLAAKGAIKEDPVEEVASFVCRDPEVIVRCLHDKDRSVIVVRVFSTEGSVGQVELPGRSEGVEVDRRGHGSVDASAELLAGLRETGATVQLTLRP